MKTLNDKNQRLKKKISLTDSSHLTLKSLGKILNKSLFSILSIYYYNVLTRQIKIQQHPLYNSIKNWLDVEQTDYTDRHYIKVHLIQQLCTQSCNTKNEDSKRIIDKLKALLPYPKDNPTDQQKQDIEILLIIHILSVSAR